MTPPAPAGAHGDGPGEGRARLRADRVSLDQSLNMLMLVVLDSLEPEERVAFILHDVFGVPFGGIADVVGRSPESTRELARSARRRIRHRRKEPGSERDHRRVVLELLAGCEAGDETAVRATLHPDITAMIDSGGRVDAARAPVHGPDRVAPLLVHLFAEAPGISVTEQSVNGHSGLVFDRAGEVVGVLSAHLTAGRIIELWIVVNPDKLGHWNGRTS